MAQRTPHDPERDTAKPAAAGSSRRLDVPPASFGDYGSSPAAWGTDGGYAAAPGEPEPVRRRGPKGWQRSDDRILDDVCQQLADEAGVDPSDVSVAVAAGKVTLSGSVPDRGMKYRIEDIVESRSGVIEVDNRLRVVRSGAGSLMAGAAMGLSTTTDARGGAGQPPPESRGGLLGRLFGFGARTRLADTMTRSPRTVTAVTPVAEVARLMAEEDVGAVPVVDGDRLIGMVTDRDLVVRVIAAGRTVDDATAGDAMTREVHARYEDEDIRDALDTMRDLRVRRIPVLDRDDRLVGIVSLGDFAVQEAGDVRDALQDISQRG